MDFNSRILGILSIFLVLAVLTASAGAAEYSLVKGDFGNMTFEMDVPSECEFGESVSNSFSFDDVGFAMDIIENTGKNAEDVNVIMHFKDTSSSNQSFIADLANDLQNDGPVVEENDNYFIVKTQSSDWNIGSDWNVFDSNWGDDVDHLFSSADSLLSGKNDISINSGDSSVQISGNGISVEDPEGNLSVGSDGINVSGFDNSTVSDNLDADINSNVQSSDYVACIKDPDNKQAILICGNDLDLLKAMAETASFKE